MAGQSVDTQAHSNSSVEGTGTAPSGTSFAAKLYAEFGGSTVGHIPWLIIPASILSLISAMGIMMNGSVVYVTIRTKYVPMHKKQHTSSSFCYKIERVTV